ncbi:MAG: TolC family protein, partial [Bacteroidaceae bacterium]|nr:TolC family protein [Bacteroidaceae bacterium]
MNMKKLMTLAAFLAGALDANAEMWTLRECIDYALEHNITINKNRVAEEAGESNLAQYKSQLWPSLTFSTMQNVTYRPLQDDITTRTVDG